MPAALTAAAAAKHKALGAAPGAPGGAVAPCSEPPVCWCRTALEELGWRAGPVKP